MNIDKAKELREHLTGQLAKATRDGASQWAQVLDKDDIVLVVQALNATAPRPEACMRSAELLSYMYGKLVEAEAFGDTTCERFDAFEMQTLVDGLRLVRGAWREAQLLASVKALTAALQDEIESKAGRELTKRDLPKEWHVAQRLLTEVET